MQITELSPLPGRKRKYRVCLEDGNSFVLYSPEVSRYELRENEQLSPETYERLLKETLIPRAKRRAMYLLQQMDRSRRNLQEKLKENGYPAEAVEAALSYVESYHYVDDERMARSFVRFAKEKKSRHRILQDLLAKGIDREVIELALEEEFTEPEEDQIRMWIRKKGYSDETAEPKERAKMVRFLAGKGFSSSDIFRVLRSGEE